MTRWPEYVAGTTTHARRGAIRNAFSYGVDYVLIDPEARRGPVLFSRNRFNLFAVQDRNHGGPRKAGEGASWARGVLAERGFEADDLLLLTQPSFLGYIFNPVSFWLAYRDGALRVVIAEVTNTMGDRHSYVCALPNFAPIEAGRQIAAEKLMHVSPFQEVAGGYRFNFDVTDDKIAVRILHERGEDGVIATLVGRRRPLSNRALLWATIRRPLGALRTTLLIHYQAVKLLAKGAPFRRRPAPPVKEVS